MSGGSPIPRFGVVVLAAGQSTRMGSPKLLLEWQGRSLLRRAVEAAIDSGASDVVVVLGGHEERLRGEVASTGARTVLNPRFASGQSTSFRAGIEELDPKVGGAVFYPADQPFVTQAVIRRLVEAHAESGKWIVVSEAGQVRGAPVFLARSLFAQAVHVTGDQGARELIRANPEHVCVVHFEDERLMLDVDTPEDYRRLLLAAPDDTSGTVRKDDHDR